MLRPVGLKKRARTGAGEGYDEEGEEEDEEEDGVDDAEATERPKGKSSAKCKLVALDEGVASTARSRSRA